jgi:hypothetical protein
MAEDALITKQLSGMNVDNVLDLLTSSFDDDFLDTLVEALRKHLKEDEPKAPVIGVVATRTTPLANEFAPAAAAGAGFQRKV